MQRRTFLSAIATLTAISLGAPGAGLARDGAKLTGPFTHENLAVYFVHGDSAAGPVPLTLAEAMAKGTTTVYETGNVSELFVENTGSEEVFIQAGDIVKGGRQDRVLTISMLVPARSGRVPISSFCVEQGRWAPRGREDAARFASAAEQLPSRAAKLALKEAAAVDRPASQAITGSVPAGRAQQRYTGEQALREATGELAQRTQPRGGQSEIWDKVAETQRNLSRSLAAPVAAPESATSLQLSLENQKLKDARAAYVAALAGKAGDASDVVGVVFAINGRPSSAEIYPSHGLFNKMWGKVLAAAATEAISERAAPNGPAPAISEIGAFVAAAEVGKASQRELPTKARLETISSERALLSTVRSALGLAYHRSLVAR